MYVYFIRMYVHNIYFKIMKKSLLTLLLGIIIICFYLLLTGCKSNYSSKSQCYKISIVIKTQNNDTIKGKYLIAFINKKNELIYGYFNNHPKK